MLAIMSTSEKIDAVISLYLGGYTPNLNFQLNSKRWPTYVLIQMHEQNLPVTLVLDGFHEEEKELDVAVALCQGVLELIDMETQNPISIPPIDEAVGSIPASSGTRRYGLTLDSTNSFWKELLHVGYKYEFRWSESVGQSRCYYRQPDESLKNVTRLPVRRMPKPITFTVQDDPSASPQLSVSLSASAKVCHLSGEPRFAIEIEVTSHAKDTITVCLDKTPLRELHGLKEVLNAVNDETDEEVEWPYVIGCFDPGKDYFPSDDMFEEFAPEVPYRHIFPVDPFDSKTMNGGEPDALEENRPYKVKLNKDILRSFGNWKNGTKADLLTGTKDEKKKIW